MKAVMIGVAVLALATASYAQQNPEKARTIVLTNFSIPTAYNPAFGSNVITAPGQSTYFPSSAPLSNTLWAISYTYQPSTAVPVYVGDMWNAPFWWVVSATNQLQATSFPTNGAVAYFGYGSAGGSAYGTNVLSGYNWLRWDAAQVDAASNLVLQCSLSSDNIYWVSNAMKVSVTMQGSNAVILANRLIQLK
jgi:hypothetical protein